MSRKPSSAGSRAAIETLVREEWGRVLAILNGYVRDLQVAEDVLQDACIKALERWPQDGIPENPRAWLLQTARRQAIDRFRRVASFRAKQPELERMIHAEADRRTEEVDETIPDERLRLMFTCCHPALAQSARVALTLRTLGGLTTTEIARAFLVPDVTMAQRLVRARRKIQAAGIPYRVPPPQLWSDRLGSVLSVVYLIFNEGYAATTGGAPTRAALCREALHLGTVLVELVPREPEASGLLALMLLHDARHGARIDEAGDLVILEDQDRALWNRDQIETGTRMLKRAMARGPVGPYQIQAAISAIHASSESHDQTDWNEILLLYRKLYETNPTPVVKLNEAVTLGWVKGPAAGLDALADLQEPLRRYQPFHAARADLLRRADRAQEAIAAYRQALEYTGNEAERRFLTGRIEALERSL